MLNVDDAERIGQLVIGFIRGDQGTTAFLLLILRQRNGIEDEIVDVQNGGRFEQTNAIRSQRLF